MSNTYGQFFEDLGGVDNPDVPTWKNIDMIEINFSETVRQLKAANGEQFGRRVLLQLLDEIGNSNLTETEKNNLCNWIEDLIEANVIIQV